MYRSPCFSRFLRVPLDDVREGFRRFGLLDDRVQFVPGYFQDSLPGLRAKLLSRTIALWSPFFSTEAAHPPKYWFFRP